MKLWTHPWIDMIEDQARKQYPHLPTTCLPPAHTSENCVGEVNLSSLKTKGVYIDYKQLKDLFSNTDEDEDSMISIQFIIYDEAYNASTNDAPVNLK